MFGDCYAHLRTRSIRSESAFLVSWQKSCENVSEDGIGPVLNNVSETVPPSRVTVSALLLAGEPFVNRKLSELVTNIDRLHYHLPSRLSDMSGNKSRSPIITIHSWGPIDIKGQIASTVALSFAQI
jgi:hypothetical protein